MVAKKYSEAELRERAEKALVKSDIVTSLSHDNNAIVAIADQLHSASKLDDYTADYGEDCEIGIARVKDSDPPRFRFFNMPSKNSIFDIPAVTDKLYTFYAAGVARNAKNPDSTAAKFASPAAMFLPKISDAVFRELAQSVIKVLSDQYKAALAKAKLPERALNMTIAQLKAALMSEATAKSTFPGFSADIWDRMLQIMIAMAEKSGRDPLIFQVWQQQRKLVADQTVKVTIDLDEMAASIAGTMETGAAEVNAGAEISEPSSDTPPASDDESAAG
jgi:hypothetical protein